MGSVLEMKCIGGCGKSSAYCTCKGNTHTHLWGRRDPDVSVISCACGATLSLENGYRELAESLSDTELESYVRSHQAELRALRCRAADQHTLVACLEAEKYKRQLIKESNGGDVA